MMKKILLITILISYSLPLSAKWQEVSSYLGMSYKLYVPSQGARSSSLPMIVALHGCKQNAEIFSSLTKLNELAEQHKFVVLYPEQNKFRNIDNCWNWFFPMNQQQSYGELYLIHKIVEKILVKYNINKSKIFSLGLSAGGAMANQLVNCYRDTFSAVAIHSGLQFAAASNPLEANQILLSESKLPPNESALRAYQCDQMQHKKLPTIIIVGTDDSRLNPKHSLQLLKQSMGLQDYLDDGLANQSINFSQTSKLRFKVPNGRYYKWSIWGKNLIHLIEVEGMNHAWSGGAVNFSNSDPTGPDASKIIWDFFNSI